MFWITYMITFLIQKIVYRASYAGIPKQNFVYTILGFDSYFFITKQTFVIVGEWFLGCIILVYILFPLLRWGVNKHPGTFTAALILLYLLAIVCYQTGLSKSELVVTRLPEVFFGMIYMKYFRKTNWKVALGALAVLIANTILAPAFSSNIQTTYIGIAAFLVLTFIAKYLKCGVVKAICSFLSRYSYAIFLIHHFIIYKITDKVDFYKISTAESYGVFAICVGVIIVASVVLQLINDKVKVGFSIIAGKLRLNSKKGDN